MNVEKYIDNIEQLLKNIEVAGLEKTIDIVKLELLNIKTILRDNNNLYVEISTRVASEIQQLIFEEVNKAQGDKNTLFKKTLENAWKIIEWIGSLDTSEEFLSHYQNNKNILKNLCYQVGFFPVLYNFPKIPQLNFIIQSSEITSTDRENNPLPITNPLYRKDTRFVGLKIDVEVFENQTVTIYEKYIALNGKLYSNSKSPKGYTSSISTDIDVNTKNIDLLSWGNADECIFAVGEHCIELWVDNYRIHKKEFFIDNTPLEKLEIELTEAENKLKEINNTQFYLSELQTANFIMSKIQKFHLFRNRKEKQKQILGQLQIIANIQQKAADEKKRQTAEQEKVIQKLKNRN